jgi:hypothetical protein
MRSTFKTLLDDNLVVFEPQRARFSERDADLDDLVGLAEYIVPVGSMDFARDPSRDEVDAIIDWADTDPEALRQAWMLAVHRCGAREVRRGTVELLATALHRAEERVTPNDPRRARSAPARGTRPRDTTRSRQPLRSA